MPAGLRGLFPLRFWEFSERSLKRPAPCQEDSSLDEVLEFTNVARPGPSRQSLHDSRRNRFDPLLHFLRELLDEIADEQRNVFFAVPQRRNTDRKDIQPLVQVTAKFLVRNHFLEIAIRCRHQADIHLPCMRAAETFKFHAPAEPAAASAESQVGMSPTSSKNRVPWSASSSRPILEVIAPVNAPFSWPNSSLSTRPVGIAADFSSRSARRRCRPDDFQMRPVLPKRGMEERTTELRSIDGLHPTAIEGRLNVCEREHRPLGSGHQRTD